MDFLKLHATQVILRRIIQPRLKVLVPNIPQTICRRRNSIHAGECRSYVTLLGNNISPHRQCHVQSQILCKLNLNSVVERCLPRNLFSTNIPDGKSEQNVNEADQTCVQSLVDNLVEKASEIDKMITTISKAVLYKQVECLLSKGMEEEDVMRLCSHPDTLSNLSRVVELLGTWHQYGFTNTDILHLVKHYPNIVRVEKAQFISVCQELQKVGFLSGVINSMILKCPALLDCDISSKLSMIDELKLLFKKNDTMKLLERDPALLFQDMSYILERFHYVFHQMGITQPQIMCTQLFTYPMEHIMARHLFVIRTGYFKKVNKSKGQLDLNPKLDTIIDSSDDKFAKQFGNMTSLDYLTFKKLLLEEKLNEEELDE